MSYRPLTTILLILHTMVIPGTLLALALGFVRDDDRANPEAEVAQASLPSPAALASGRWDPSPEPSTTASDWYGVVHITRSAVQRLVSQTPDRTARLQPARSLDQPGAYRDLRITQIRPGSLFSALGLRDGDVLHAINGRPVTGGTWASGMDLRPRVPTTITLTRQGRRGRILVFVDERPLGSQAF